MEGAPELLRQCREQRVAMALVTSSGRESLALKTAPHPWLELIELRIHGDEPALSAGKPAPDPISIQTRASGKSGKICALSTIWRVQIVERVEGATRFLIVCQRRSIAT